MNLLYRFNKWLDRSNYTLLIILLPILIANLLLTLTDFLWLGISILVIICSLALFRMRMLTGQIKFNRKDYNIPSIGEKIIIKKGFYWNGEFHKRCPKTDMGSKPWYFTICKGEEWEVIEIRELDSDWIIYLEDKHDDNIHIKYFESNKYWTTKSDIRNNKLKKLGI